MADARIKLNTINATNTGLLFIVLVSIIYNIDMVRTSRDMVLARYECINANLV